MGVLLELYVCWNGASDQQSIDWSTNSTTYLSTTVLSYATLLSYCHTSYAAIASAT